MEQIKISIITPSYNQAKFLEETILSVIDQEYIALEYIVIDGGSNDGSVEIIKKYEDKISFWVSEPDKGQSDAINKGLKKATGEIVAWLNSDDFYLPGTLKKVNQIFQNNPDIDLIYGNGINYIHNEKKTVCIAPQFEEINFLSKTSTPQPSMFWRKKVHDKIGYIDEELYYSMDYDLWMRIFYSCQTLKIDEVFACLRAHPDAKTAFNPTGLYIEYRKILSRFFNSFEKSSMVDKIKGLDIYLNERGIKYNLPQKNHPFDKMLDTYIHQCALQEYSWKNIKKANILFLASLHEPSLITNIFFLLKNNLRIKYLFP